MTLEFEELVKWYFNKLIFKTRHRYLLESIIPSRYGTLQSYNVQRYELIVASTTVNDLEISIGLIRRVGCEIILDISSAMLLSVLHPLEKHSNVAVESET